MHENMDVVLNPQQNITVPITNFNAILEQMVAELQFNNARLQLKISLTATGSSEDISSPHENPIKIIMKVVA